MPFDLDGSVKLTPVPDTDVIAAQKTKSKVSFLKKKLIFLNTLLMH